MAVLCNWTVCCGCLTLPNAPVASPPLRFCCKVFKVGGWVEFRLKAPSNLQIFVQHSDATQ